jgi:hypothetical protein
MTDLAALLRKLRREGYGEVTGRTLADLRRGLRERVELKGGWWGC